MSAAPERTTPVETRRPTERAAAVESAYEVAQRRRRLLRRLALAAAVAVIATLAARMAAQDLTRFVLVTMNGLTLAGLYFLVASGFTLVFGVMRVVNMAHGVYYLVGGYIGWSVWQATDSWVLALVAAALSIATIGLLTRELLLRWVPAGEPLREALITIGLIIILADQVVAIWGGRVRVLNPPEILAFSIELPFLAARYPAYRVFVLAMGLLIGGLLWALLQRTKVGIVLRAAVDDRYMLSALGTNVNVVYAATFALGALLAGVAGVVGGTFSSLAIGVDGQFLLISLVIVILGGMGSLGGAAIASLLVGLVDAFAATLHPQYAVLYVFVLLGVVLVLRPQGLFGRAE
jgi:branched-chain amino acid transport system permease protein